MKENYSDIIRFSILDIDKYESKPKMTKIKIKNV